MSRPSQKHATRLPPARSRMPTRAWRLSSTENLFQKVPSGPAAYTWPVERYKTARNLAIIVAIAAAIYFVPGGGRVASTFAAALWTAFGVGVGFAALFFYRERRVWVHGLGDRHRAMLYGAIGLGVFAWVARARMWASQIGHPAWFVL